MSSSLSWSSLSSSLSKKIAPALGLKHLHALAVRSMKWGGMAACCALAGNIGFAGDEYAAGYSAVPYYTSSDAIVAFDWGADGELYFTRGFFDGGFYRAGAGQDILVSTHDGFGGDGMEVYGDYVYYNWSSWSNDQFIQRYNVVTGESDLVSTSLNWGLAMYNGTLFISGGTYENGSTEIYFSPLAADGSFVFDPPRFIGETWGASGPIALSLSGDIYYSPGLGNLSLYRWSAAELAAAMDDPFGAPLKEENGFFVDLEAMFGSAYAGSTSMAIDENGDIYLTLTDFMSDSQLVRITPDGVGEVVMVSDERLGEIRFWEGNLYIASGDTLYMVIPEPSTVMLLSAFGAALLFARGWKGRRGAV